MGAFTHTILYLNGLRSKLISALMSSIDLIHRSRRVQWFTCIAQRKWCKLATQCWWYLSRYWQRRLGTTHHHYLLNSYSNSWGDSSQPTECCEIAMVLATTSGWQSNCASVWCAIEYCVKPLVFSSELAKGAINRFHRELIRSPAN